MNIELTKNKEVHLIKLDIDGTSTNPDFSTLNEGLNTVLQKLKERGHKICFTTGRNYFSALPFYNEVKLDTFLVTYNGAYINNPSDQNNQEAVVLNPIKNKIVKDILSEPIIKKNLCNVLIDRVDLKTISTSDDIYYQEIFFNGNPYTKTEEEVIEDEVTSSYEPEDKFKQYQIYTKKNGRLLYYPKEYGEKKKEEIPQKGEKWFFALDGKTEKETAKKISDFKKRKEELTLNSSKILQLFGEKDALQLVLEFPGFEVEAKRTFNEILTTLHNKYGSSTTFYYGGKLKAERPGEKILVPDPKRKVIKIRSILASKGEGTKWVVDKYRIPLSRVIAFGNDDNDIELMHTAGHSVATADSSSYLKRCASYRMTDHGLFNSEGVAKYLKDYFGLD